MSTPGLPQTPRDAAVHILASLKATYSAPLKFVLASEADFAHLDLPAYAEFRTWAEGQSFRYLADIEFPALSNNSTTPVARAMVRTHLSADGTVGAEYFQVKPRIDRVLKRLATGLLNLRWIDTPRWVWRMLKTKNCASFETEFDDGTFVASSNAEAAGLLSLPPSIDTVFMPYGTPPQELLDAHRARVRLKLQNQPQCRAIVVTDLAGVREQQHRMSGQKNAYRAAQQWISKAELNAMTGNRELADAVFEEMRKLQAGPMPDKLG